MPRMSDAERHAQRKPRADRKLPRPPVDAGLAGRVFVPRGAFFTGPVNVWLSWFGKDRSGESKKWLLE